MRCKIGLMFDLLNRHLGHHVSRNHTQTLSMEEAGTAEGRNRIDARSLILILQAANLPLNGPLRLVSADARWFWRLHLGKDCDVDMDGAEVPAVLLTMRTPLRG